MTEWPEGWHPANAVEACEYLDAHPDGGERHELLAECRTLCPAPPIARPFRGLPPVDRTRPPQSPEK